MDSARLDLVFQKYSQHGTVPASSLEGFVNDAMDTLALPHFSSQQISTFRKEVDTNADGHLTKSSLYQAIQGVYRNCHPASRSEACHGWVPPN